MLIINYLLYFTLPTFKEKYLKIEGIFLLWWHTTKNKQHLPFDTSVCSPDLSRPPMGVILYRVHHPMSYCTFSTSIVVQQYES